MSSQKMVRLPKEALDGLNELAENHGIDRKALIRAAVLILTNIMNRKSTSINIAGEDGQVYCYDIPILYVKDKK